MSYGDYGYVTSQYHPTREEAIRDFKHLYKKLKNGLYGDGDDLTQDFADWREDFQWMPRVYFYCIFDNEDKQQMNSLRGMYLELFIKEAELARRVGG